MAHGDSVETGTPELSGKFADLLRKKGNDERKPAAPAGLSEEQAATVQAPVPRATAALRSSKKAKPSEKALRAKDKGDRTERMGFEVTKAEKKLINNAKNEIDVAVTHFARASVLGYINNGYVCAACGKRFSIINEEGEKEKPQACPCCLSDKFSRIVRL